MSKLKLACLAVFLVAIGVSVIVDIETFGAEVCISLVVLPSILLFLALERRFTSQIKHVAYFASLLPMALIVIYPFMVTVDSGDASRAMAGFIGISYFFQALAAYLVLAMLPASSVLRSRDGAPIPNDGCDGGEPLARR